MSERDAIDDLLLSAWLDGELDDRPDDKARVDAWLREHPADAQRVRLWAADRDALRARLPLPADEPLPGPWRALLQLDTAAPRRWALAAAAAGLLLAGGVVGALLATQWPGRAPPVLAAAPAPWVQRAAYAHSVYVPEPRHAVEVRAQEEHLARWLTRRIDVPVKLFDLLSESELKAMKPAAAPATAPGAESQRK